MESVLTATEKQSMVSSFLEIAVGQSAETAKQFLQATSWQLEEAIQLFYIGNESSGLVSSVPPTAHDAPLQTHDNQGGLEENAGSKDIPEAVEEDGVRPPLPVKREVLYDDVAPYGISGMGHSSNSIIAFRNFDEESRQHGVWESGPSATSTIEASRDNLASLYRPPFALMHLGPFDKAKVAASLQGKWLLVNLQSTKEFSSHMLNRDTWANEAVAQTISSNFIFWQVYDDTSEGRKVCTYYKLYSIPVVLVIDPLTGQKMRSWNGMVEPERLLEDLVPFMDKGPQDHRVVLPHKRPRESASAHASSQKISTADETAQEEDEDLLRALEASMEDRKDTIKSANIDNKEPKLVKEERPKEVEKEAETSSSKEPTYPPLPDEPKCDRSLLCRVGIRLPNGRRFQRNFLLTDPIQLLWSFCFSQLKEKEEVRPFRLAQAIPGATQTLDYEIPLTFGESGLSNSMLTLTWE